MPEIKAKVGPDAVLNLSPRNWNDARNRRENGQAFEPRDMIKSGTDGYGISSP